MTTPSQRPERPQRQERPVTSLDDERFSSAFDSAFKATMRKAGISISEAETSIERLPERKVRASVRIYGMAGDITSHQFYNPKTKVLVQGAEAVRVAPDGYTPAIFKFARVTNLTGNEFAVEYEQE